MVAVVRSCRMPITHLTVTLRFVLQDLTGLLVYLTTCERSCRPNSSVQATLDALITARLRRRAAANSRAQLLSSSSIQMNHSSGHLTDSSGWQQASPVQLRPGQQASAVHRQPEQQASPVQLQPGQQASPVHLQPWQQQITHLWRSGATPAIHMPPHDTTDDFADFITRVQAERLQAGAATGSATRCASKCPRARHGHSLFCHVWLHKGGPCLHNKCVRQYS